MMNTNVMHVCHQIKATIKKGCTKEDGESSVGREKQVSLQIQQSEVSWEEIIQGIIKTENELGHVDIIL